MSKFCASCDYEFKIKEPKCPHCGASYLIAKNHKKEVTSVDAAQFNPILQLLFFQPKNKSDKYFVKGRYVISGFMAILTLFVFLNSVESSIVLFLHNANLPFHEFGHIIFSLFGSDLLTSMGGTLFQILMPLICMFVFILQNRDPFAASVALWWAGENFVDIAPYIADARAGVLPLLGGNTGQTAPYGFHDWEFILGELGISHLDITISYFSQIFGIVVMILSVLWGLYILINLKKLTFSDW